jgi:tetratricopeptide (TPR) repeat protein
VAEAAAVIDTVQWPDAVPALARADKLLIAAGRTELPLQLRAMQRDLTMVRRLEQISEQPDDAILHSGYETSEGFQAANAAYLGAFQEYGIDPLDLLPAEADQRLRASNIRLTLASGLDAWAYQRVKDGKNNTGWQRLLQAAKTADPDPWRNRLRDLLLSVDPRQPLPADVGQRLRALADSADDRTLPAGTLLLLWRTLEAAGAAEASIPLLRRAQLQYPGDFRLNIALAHACMHTRTPRHPEDAARFYTAALAARPDSRYVRFHLAEALCAKGAFAAAVEEANALLELQPDDPAAIGLRAQVALAMNKPEQTIVDCSRLIAQKPGLIAALALRGEAYERLKQWKEALVDYDEAIRVAARQHVYLYPMRARVHATRGQWQAALADHEQATILAPAIPQYWHARSHAQGVLGNWGAAAFDMSSAVARKPADSGWWMEMIVYLLRDGDFSNALASCNEMMKRFGSSSEPMLAHRVALVFLLSPKTGAPPAAAVKLAAHAARVPQIPWFVLTHGAALHRTGAWAQAVEVLEPLDKKWPQGPAIDGGRCVGWLLLAMAYQKLGHAQAARQWLDRAVEQMDRETAAPTIGPLRQEAHVWAMCQLLRGEAEGLLKTAD